MSLFVHRSSSSVYLLGRGMFLPVRPSIFSKEHFFALNLVSFSKDFSGICIPFHLCVSGWPLISQFIHALQFPSLEPSRMQVELWSLGTYYRWLCQLAFPFLCFQEWGLVLFSFFFFDGLLFPRNSSLQVTPSIGNSRPASIFDAPSAERGNSKKNRFNSQLEVHF